MDYAELPTLVTGYLPSVTGEDDQAVLAGMITRASRAIDSRTRRPADAFAPAPEESSEQVFYGAGSPVLRLSEFVAGSVEGVTAPSGYMPDGFREFRRRDQTTGSTVVGLHTSRSDGILTPHISWKANVPFTVTARWGFAATPPEITEATLQLVRGWWQQQAGNLSGPTGDVNPRPESALASVWRAVDELIAPYVLEEAIEDADAGTIERGELRDADTNADGGGWGRW